MIAPEHPSGPVLVALILLAVLVMVACLAVILYLLGMRHGSPSPAPMVTDVQLPDVAGDGS